MHTHSPHKTQEQKPKYTSKRSEYFWKLNNNFFPHHFSYTQEIEKFHGEVTLKNDSDGLKVDSCSYFIFIFF